MSDVYGVYEHDVCVVCSVSCVCIGEGAGMSGVCVVYMMCVCECRVCV